MSTLPIPGSVVLVDLDGQANGPHSTAYNDIILHPTPSRDVNDPLNWSKWRKQLHFAMLMTCAQHSPTSYLTPRRHSDGRYCRHGVQLRPPPPLDRERRARR